MSIQDGKFIGTQQFIISLTSESTISSKSYEGILATASDRLQ